MLERRSSTKANVQLPSENIGKYWKAANGMKVICLFLVQYEITTEHLIVDDQKPSR